MPDVTPSGILSTAPAKLADMIAACSAWQAMTGAANAAAALAYIRLAAWGEPDEELADALCVVTLPRNSVIGRGGFGTGRLYTIWRADIAAEHAGSHRNAALEFTNAMGAVFEQLLAAAEGSGALLIRRITIDVPPQRAKTQAARRKNGTLADYMQMSAIVDFGLEAL